MGVPVGQYVFLDTELADDQAGNVTDISEEGEMLAPP